MQAFVELPPIPKIYPAANHQKVEPKWDPQTPSQKAIGKRKAVEPDDMHDLGSDEDDWLARGMKSSRRATGDKDERGVSLD